MRLEGKVSLISGAATGVEGQTMGFGGASAHLFVGEGAKVVIADIDEDQGEKTVSQIRERGDDVMFVRLDVTRDRDWTDAVQATVSHFGRLDILVNSAGTTVRTTVEETTEDVWDQQMDVHAKGTFLGTKHAIPEMRKAGGGSIVNVSSIAGLVGFSSSTAYQAAKGAIRTFTKSAAIQYARHGIRVNTVFPGFAMTPMTKAIFRPGEALDARLSSVPMGRLATPEEIAYGILYLASDESSFVTGSDLVIDGGMTAQ